MCPRTCRNELYCKIKSYLFLDVSFDELLMYNVTLGVHEASYVFTQTTFLIPTANFPLEFVRQ